MYLEIHLSPLSKTWEATFLFKQISSVITTEKVKQHLVFQIHGERERPLITRQTKKQQKGTKIFPSLRERETFLLPSLQQISNAHQILHKVTDVQRFHVRHFLILEFLPEQSTSPTVVCYNNNMMKIKDSYNENTRKKDLLLFLRLHCFKGITLQLIQLCFGNA